MAALLHQPGRRPAKVSREVALLRLKPPLLAVTALLATVLPLRAGASGLLLGTDVGRTFWIRPSKSGVAVLELPGLIVPRERGFWRLDRAYLVRTDPPTGGSPPHARGAEAWSLSAVERPVPPTVPEGWRQVQDWEGPDLCEEQRKVIRFLSPRLIAFEDVSVSECGVHPDGSTELRTARLDQWESERAAIGDLLAESGRSAFDAALRAATDKYFADWGNQHCGEPNPDQRSWVIARDRGRWRARARAETHRLCGGGFEFEIAVVLPESLVGPDRLPLAWSEIEAAVPGAFDAMASPRGDLLVVLTPDGLVAFGPTERGIGTPIGRHSFRGAPSSGAESGGGGGARIPTERAVLIEWATGRYVPIWTEGLSQVARTGSR